MSRLNRYSILTFLLLIGCDISRPEALCLYPDCKGCIENQLNDIQGASSKLMWAFCNSEQLGLSKTRETLDSIKLVHKDSSTLSLLISLGDSLFNSNHIEEALIFFEKGIKSDPTNTNLMYNLGITNYELGNDSTAQAYFLSVLKKDKGCFKCWYVLSDIHVNKEDYNQANKMLETAYRIQPDSEYYRIKSKILIMSNKLDSANEVLDNGVESFPNESHIYKTRGLFYLNTYDEKNAINDFKKALELNPDDTDCYYNMALCYAYLKDYESACNFFSTYIDVAGDISSLSYNFDSLCINNQ